MNLTEKRAEFLADARVIRASQWFAPDSSDAARNANGAALKRRIELIVQNSDGSVSLSYPDVMVADLGGAGETVLDAPPIPADKKSALRDAVETWLDVNLAARVPGALRHRIISVFEDDLYAEVSVLVETVAPVSGKGGEANWQTHIVQRDGAAVSIRKVV